MESLLKIRGKRIWPNVTPSPMSGVTDRPFRQVLWELAGGRIGMSVTEFVSVNALQRYTAPFFRQMRTFPGEYPLCIQIFGAEPEAMAHGAIQMVEAGADFVEINAGCPMQKVIGKGGGSSLLRDLPRLQHILQAVRKAIDVPLFLKVRLGWDEKSINVLETLHLAENEGVELFTIHGRTRVQGYKGLADWDLIAATAAKAKIPVMGNGDIHSAQEAQSRLLEIPQLAGVGVGRALMHNPFLMGQVADLWEGKPIREPTGLEQLAMLQRYAQLLEADGFSPTGVLGRLKQMMARLTRCLEPDASDFRLELLHTLDLDRYMDRLALFYETEYKPQGYRFIPGRIESLNGKHSIEMEYGRQFRG
ncbi:MAG TPA: tRNA-dihydrouridine synthase [Fibrobacteraceae bacterium]|nr:tRNA-dihydrouridine synthase [Fibrobacteraceae bacterium]